ncbi:MAG: flippase-like domain-containing protein [Alphaproteobacteria bacterium]
MTPRTRKRILAALAWIVGLGVIGLLIAQQDSAELIEALSAAGWWLPVFVLAFLGTLVLDSLGWRAVILHDRPVALVGLVVRRWVGVSVNALLPVAQLGGEVVRARLLRQLGPSGPIAAASVIVDLTIGLLTQIFFALLGLLLAVVVLGADRNLISLGLGLSLFAVLVLAFALLQMRGTLTSSVDLIGRFVTNGVWLQLAESAARLDEQIRAIYAQKRRVLVCGFWRLLGWLWPCLELWLIFWILGHPISLAEAVMLEAVAQVVRSAGFGIPGGLGVQEGGVMLAATLLGVPTELALAAMLIRRVREFACGLAGLVTWLLLEGKSEERVAVA